MQFVCCPPTLRGSTWIISMCVWRDRTSHGYSPRHGQNGNPMWPTAKCETNASNDVAERTQIVARVQLKQRLRYLTLHSISPYFLHFLLLIYLSFFSQLPAMKYAYCCYCSYTAAPGNRRLYSVAFRPSDSRIPFTQLSWIFASKVGSY